MFQYRKLSELKKLENNPRYILDDDFERLVQSVKNNPAHFDARPLILSDRTGDLVIIAGNQRYEAAKKLGMTKVPTFLISGLTEEQEQEIIIRDNVSNGDFDHEILSTYYDQQALKDWGVHVPDVEVPELAPEPETKISKKLLVECELLDELEKLYSELQTRGFVCSLK